MGLRLNLAESTYSYILNTPLVPPSATKCPMPIKSNKEDWVLALRVFLKDTLGTSWQIRETKGKARLGILFKDGARAISF